MIYKQNLVQFFTLFATTKGQYNITWNTLHKTEDNAKFKVFLSSACYRHHILTNHILLHRHDLRLSACHISFMVFLTAVGLDFVSKLQQKRNASISSKYHFNDKMINMISTSFCNLVCFNC